jgi:transposase
MAFATGDLFAAVVAPLAAGGRCFDALAVDARRAGSRFAPRCHAYFGPQSIHHTLPSTVVTPLKKRWVVERTNAWNGRYRRHSKDYERTVESSAAMIQVSQTHLLLRRLAPPPDRGFRYRATVA